MAAERFKRLESHNKTRAQLGAVDRQFKAIRKLTVDEKRALLVRITEDLNNAS
jgi:hypothetical protein